ncbi:hypothetical protein J6590_006459 [Homalodisca vitripennis]|nr:hypothetical protein J6590_006459 [Homalodisca vitripennis]
MKGNRIACRGAGVIVRGVLTVETGALPEPRPEPLAAADYCLHGQLTTAKLNHLYTASTTIGLKLARKLSISSREYDSQLSQSISRSFYSESLPLSGLLQDRFWWANSCRRWASGGRMLCRVGRIISPLESCPLPVAMIRCCASMGNRPTPVPSKTASTQYLKTLYTSRNIQLFASNDNVRDGNNMLLFELDINIGIAINKRAERDEAQHHQYRVRTAVPGCSISGAGGGPARCRLTGVIDKGPSICYYYRTDETRIYADISTILDRSLCPLVTGKSRAGRPRTKVSTHFVLAIIILGYVQRTRYRAPCQSALYLCTEYRFALTEYAPNSTDLLIDRIQLRSYRVCTQLYRSINRLNTAPLLQYTNIHSANISINRLNTAPLLQYTNTHSANMRHKCLGITSPRRRLYYLGNPRTVTELPDSTSNSTSNINLGPHVRLVRPLTSCGLARNNRTSNITLRPTCPPSQTSCGLARNNRTSNITLRPTCPPKHQTSHLGPHVRLVRLLWLARNNRTSNITLRPTCPPSQTLPVTTEHQTSYNRTSNITLRPTCPPSQTSCGLARNNRTSNITLRPTCPPSQTSCGLARNNRTSNITLRPTCPPSQTSCGLARNNRTSNITLKPTCPPSQTSCGLARNNRTSNITLRPTCPPSQTSCGLARNNRTSNITLRPTCPPSQTSCGLARNNRTSNITLRPTCPPSQTSCGLARNNRTSNITLGPHVRLVRLCGLARNRTSNHITHMSA